MVQRYDNFGLTQQQRTFVEHYVIYGNGTKAAIHAGYSVKSATVTASGLLTKANVIAYIQACRNEAAELAGVTALRIMLELSKIAFSSHSAIHKNWITLEQFEQLPQEVKDSIKSIKSKTEKTSYGTKVHYVEVELFDKLTALKMLNQMCGFDQPVKVDLVDGKNPLLSSRPREVKIIKPLPEDE